MKSKEMQAQIERQLAPKLLAAITSLCQIEILLQHWDVTDERQLPPILDPLRDARQQCHDLLHLMTDEEEDHDHEDARRAIEAARDAVGEGR